ncbi:succinate dehydrogenase cytochrome b subunit [candidate division KSB1 bacterium]|nr:succinate dehydrogenase cytochrome b subunit [candidate division KSB1 bacterium]NIR72644.1 succinate dehydrogenase cytochrome b subunit [candidate division KSB1 bacterium]NIS23674.1 succinate dehydrogenase cytochrome b subunit [candidate division KSB1 bacterium]NIT70594.1 succinate dehydrogenase cytochrome b subunit [candidate division KSB1 bacterium]NIU24322.1 succinate dehydrogenase cytochrome b subunit [candidate division KSB1 bacterium]
MVPFSKLLWSSVGKKVVMAITGLAMIIFLIEHLSGNLLLFNKNPEPFNKYSHFLISFGSILVVVELILVAILVFHMISGISIALGKRKARPSRYAKTGSAGGASKKTFSSMTMIYTGILLFVFVVIHLKTFKYGPGIEEGYVVATNGGEQIRDLHGLVYDVFQKPGYVIWYVVSMMFLGFHLRHGFWSAFQSLGAYHPRYMPIIYSVGIIVAIVLAVGFLGIPLWIYFTGA